MLLHFNDVMRAQWLELLFLGDVEVTFHSLELRLRDLLVLLAAALAASLVLLDLATALAAAL
eukprot:8221467-Heterocapsa_arctica.AAC.1